MEPGMGGKKRVRDVDWKRCDADRASHCESSRLLTLSLPNSSLWGAVGGEDGAVLISVPEAAEAGLDDRNPNAWGYGDGIEEHWGKLGWKTCSTGKRQVRSRH